LHERQDEAVPPLQVLHPLLQAMHLEVELSRYVPLMHPLPQVKFVRRTLSLVQDLHWFEFGPEQVRQVSLQGLQDLLADK